MPTKGSCLKLLTSGSSKCKVKRMTLITPSKIEFLVFPYYTSAGLRRIRSSNFRNSCQPGKAILTFSKRCKITQQWVLHPQAQEYTVVRPTKCKDLHGSADFVDGFFPGVKQTSKMHIVRVGAIVGPVHLVWENASLCGMDSVWLENNRVDLDTYWTGY